jgi:hypothetical protein
MQGKKFRRVLKVVAVVLVFVLSATVFNKVGDYYLKRPTIVIILFISAIILIYIIVFFKEIFLRRRSK